MLTKYDMHDLLDSDRMSGAKGSPIEGVHTGYVTRYLEMGIYSISNSRIIGYITETGDLLEIRYHNWRVLPWGEAHKMGTNPRYNKLVDPEWFTMDMFLDYLDEVDEI